MKRINDAVIIGVDHGYGNIKTANHIFKAGIAGYDYEPLFTSDMLVYGGRYYVIGEGHKEFVPQKQSDEDYYLLTLAGIAMELKAEGLTEADVIIAAGLPLTWTTGQKAEFAAYLTRNAEVSFTFRKVDYHIRILGARIYPQGYAAVAEFTPSMKGVNVIVDIGNGTMNTLFIIDGKPQVGRMFTEKFGTHQCTLAIHEALMREHGSMSAFAIKAIGEYLDRLSDRGRFDFTLEDVRDMFREERRELDLAPREAEPSFTPPAEMTEEQRKENDRNVLETLDMFT